VRQPPDRRSLDGAAGPAGVAPAPDPLEAMGGPGTPASRPPGLAVGATFETAAVAVEDAVLPAASVTVRVTVKVPLSPYAWVTRLPTPVMPSPNAQAKLYGLVPPVADPVIGSINPSVLS